MIELTEAQITDLAELQQLCIELHSDLVNIGAIAYQYYFPDHERHTGDIDTAIALDLEDFDELKRRLLAMGWSNIPAREHRWVSQRGTLLDLIPAGKKLREAKSLTRPQSQFRMSLVGFDHVFSLANAYLLGLALQTICTEEEVEVVRTFLSTIGDDTKPAWLEFVRAAPGPGERSEEIARLQLDAFRKGFEGGEANPS